MVKILEGAKEFFRQPKTIKLRVISTADFDMSKYHNSLGYFFEEIARLEPNKPQYDELFDGIINIGADERPTPDGKKLTTLTVVFDEKKTELTKIQAKLEAMGIKTELTT